MSSIFVQMSSIYVQMSSIYVQMSSIYVIIAVYKTSCYTMSEKLLKKKSHQPSKNKASELVTAYLVP